MDIYKERSVAAKAAARKIFRIEDLTAVHGYKSRKYSKVRNYRIADHCNEVFTKTGKSLGVFTQPYLYDNLSHEVAELNEMGFYVYWVIEVDAWWDPDNDHCSVFFISREKNDVLLECV